MNMNWALFPALQRAWSLVAAGLLEQGLAALDQLALRETGWCFAGLDPRAQPRSLFQLEAGRGRLSRRHASAFIDAFRTLAAQAYLRDALEPVPHTLSLPLDTP